MGREGAALEAIVAEMRRSAGGRANVRLRGFEPYVPVVDPVRIRIEGVEVGAAAALSVCCELLAITGFDAAAHAKPLDVARLVRTLRRFEPVSAARLLLELLDRPNVSDAASSPRDEARLRGNAGGQALDGPSPC